MSTIFNVVARKVKMTYVAPICGLHSKLSGQWNTTEGFQT